MHNLAFSFFRTVFVLACLTLSPPAYAQSSVPRVYLIAHTNLQDTHFMHELKCMLESVFIVEVQIKEAHVVNIYGAYNSGREQYNAGDLLGILASQKEADALPDDGYIFYMIRPDIYDQGYNYLFALMNYQTNINVISLARLRHKDDGQTTDRVFRLIAKNFAKFHGHKPSGQCFMGYSNNLGQLDGRAVRLCEPDLSALKAMGLVRPEIKDQTIMKGCLLIM